MLRTLTLIATTLGSALSAAPALAHHPMGGATPSTLAQGLLSGIGHPIIGLDHLAFVIAVGIAAALLGSRFLLPLAFIGATILGTLVHLAALGLPAVEAVIAASVALVGLLLCMDRRPPLAVFAGLFALAGLFHGHAYGEAVFGAETTPVLAYLVGFAATQYAIAVLAGWAVVRGARGFAADVPARVAGGMVAGAGLLLVGERAITATLG